MSKPSIFFAPVCNYRSIMKLSGAQRKAYSDLITLQIETCLKHFNPNFVMRAFVDLIDCNKSLVNLSLDSI